MKLPTCRRALNRHLRPLLKDLGFVAEGPSSFIRPNRLGTESFRIPDRRDADRCYFSGNLGLSIQAVEEILRPESKEPYPTIWTPVHILHADRRFFEWTMRSEDDALSLASAIMEEIHTYALPFFEEYTNIETIQRRLESPTPRDWFGLGPQQKACVLAALKYLAGHIDGAFEILENALADEGSRPFPKNRDMKKLLAEFREREAVQPA